MSRRPSRRNRVDEALTLLGLPSDAGSKEIADARRRLAKQHHPDAGGSVEQMQAINDAVEVALAGVDADVHGDAASGPPADAAAATTDRRQSARRPTPGTPSRRDHPSFTVEALPAETFEALLIVAAWLGEAIDDDPPYSVEIALSEPPGAWCRLDLAPDAGASTVSLAVGAVAGCPLPSVEEVRDAFVDGLNRLDWSDLGG